MDPEFLASSVLVSAHRGHDDLLSAGWGLGGLRDRLSIVADPLHRAAVELRPGFGDVHAPLLPYACAALVRMYARLASGAKWSRSRSGAELAGRAQARLAVGARSGAPVHCTLTSPRVGSAGRGHL